MNKERIKSFVLAFLVMMNFVLGARILSDKKLWPYGYNFFLSLKNSELFGVFASTSDKMITKTHLTSPEQIIVNTGDQTSRLDVFPREELFDEINTSAEDAILMALKSDSKAISLSPKEEWVSSLNGKSICLNYPAPYETRLFSAFFGLDTTNLENFVPSFSRIVVSADNFVFFEDYKSGNFYKVETGHNSKKLSAIIDKTKSYHKNNDEIINYSVDLKFDEVFGNQKAILLPAVPVYQSPVKLPNIIGVNPIISENNTINRSVIEKLLPVFKINSNTARRYPEADGTLVFVENDGILKIHPNGVINYQSTDFNGFSLSSASDYVGTLNALADFADRINNACMSSDNLYLSGQLSYDNDVVTFDYRAEGIPVKIDFDGHKNAITAEIKNGSIKSYTHVLRNYLSGSEVYETPSFIGALDSAIEEYSVDMTNIEIQKLNLMYEDNNNGLLMPANWNALVKSIIIREEEI